MTANYSSDSRHDHQSSPTTTEPDLATSNETDSATVYGERNLSPTENKQDLINTVDIQRLSTVSERLSTHKSGQISTAIGQRELSSYESITASEKTPMCLINELSRFNKIHHEYQLIREDGPAHSKIFTVSLILGNEFYMAEGYSIKKAQHAAASIALQQTKFKHPIRRPKRPISSNPRYQALGNNHLSPSMELHSLSVKMGMRPTYIVEYAPGRGNYSFDYGGELPVRFNQTPSATSPYGSNAQLTGTSPRMGYSHIQEMDEQLLVTLLVADREFHGSGKNSQEARDNAATHALHYFQTLVQESTSDSNTEKQLEERNDAQDVHKKICNEQKSPISLVYELALKHAMKVTFNVLRDQGPPHMKVFVTQCIMGQYLVEGEGSSKRKSKKDAAQKMLSVLRKTHVTLAPDDVSVKRKRVPMKRKSRSLVKVANVNEALDGAIVANTINPISRLSQIQQNNHVCEPIYEVTRERTVGFRREFTLKVTLHDGFNTTGVGPNKRTAKRNAAEAMLMLLTKRVNGLDSQRNMFEVALNEDQTIIDHQIVETTLPSTINRKTTLISIPNSNRNRIVRNNVPGILIIPEQVHQEDTKKQVLTIEYASHPTSASLRHTTYSNTFMVRLQKLSTSMGIIYDFAHFPKASHEDYLTVISLDTKPPQVCHGVGDTLQKSKENAAKVAVDILSNIENADKVAMYEPN